MDKRDYKLERLKLRVDQERYYAEKLTDLIKNPLIEYALGMLFIAYITRGNQSVLERITGVDIMGTAWGMGLTGIITAQQLAALAPYMAPAAEQLFQALTPAKIGGLLK